MLRAAPERSGLLSASTDARRPPPIPAGVRRRLRALRADRARALRELPGRVAAAAGGDAAARRRGLRVRPGCRRLRRRGRPARRPSATACWTTGRRACTRRRRRPRAADPADRVFAAVAADAAAVRARHPAVRRSAQRVPPGRRDAPLRRVGRRCSTTAGARRTRSAAWSSASPATAAATSSRRPTACARRCSSPTSGRTSASTTGAAASTCRPKSAAAAGPRRAISPPGGGPTAWREAFDEVVRRTRILFDQGRPGRRPGQRPPAPRAAPDVAGRHADPRSGRRAGPRPARLPADAGRRRSCPGCCGAPSAGAGARIRWNPREMARDTNFYYSFLVLTPARRAGDRRGLGFLPRRRRRGRRGDGRDRGRSRRRPRPARRMAPRDRALLRRPIRRRRRRRRRARRWCRSSASSTCRAVRSPISSTAWRWTSATAASRTSPSCISTAIASPRRSASSASRSSAARTPSRATTRWISGWRCSSPTSCAT